jgi:hypothetical protein
VRLELPWNCELGRCGPDRALQIHILDDPPLRSALRPRRGPPRDARRRHTPPPRACAPPPAPGPLPGSPRSGGCATAPVDPGRHGAAARGTGLSRVIGCGV